MRTWAVTIAGWTVLLTSSCSQSTAGLAAAWAPDAGPGASRVAPAAGLAESAATQAAVDGGVPAMFDTTPAVATPPPPLTMPAGLAAPDGGMPDSGPPPDLVGAMPAEADAAPPPRDASPPPPPPLRILRVRDVTAARIQVKTIYAHRVEAKTGRVGKEGEPLPDPVLGQQLGRENLKVEELVADVLYAHDVQTGAIDADETHVSTLKIDKPTASAPP
jgi:hypothetical protein